MGPMLRIRLVLWLNFFGPSTFNPTLKPKPRMVGDIGSAHCQMNSDNSLAASRFLLLQSSGCEPLSILGVFRSP